MCTAPRVSAVLTFCAILLILFIIGFPLLPLLYPIPRLYPNFFHLSTIFANFLRLFFITPNATGDCTKMATLDISLIFCLLYIFRIFLLSFSYKILFCIIKSTFLVKSCRNFTMEIILLLVKTVINYMQLVFVHIFFLSF